MNLSTVMSFEITWILAICCCIWGYVYYYYSQQKQQLLQSNTRIQEVKTQQDHWKIKYQEIERQLNAQQQQLQDLLQEHRQKEDMYRTMDEKHQREMVLQEQELKGFFNHRNDLEKAKIREFFEAELVKNDVSAKSELEKVSDALRKVNRDYKQLQTNYEFRGQVILKYQSEQKQLLSEIQTLEREKEDCKQQIKNMEAEKQKFQDTTKRIQKGVRVVDLQLGMVSSVDPPFSAHAVREKMEETRTMQPIEEPQHEQFSPICMDMKLSEGVEKMVSTTSVQEEHFNNPRMSISSEETCYEEAYAKFKMVEPYEEPSATVSARNIGNNNTSHCESKSTASTGIKMVLPQDILLLDDDNQKDIGSTLYDDDDDGMTIRSTYR